MSGSLLALLDTILFHQSGNCLLLNNALPAVRQFSLPSKTRMADSHATLRVQMTAFSILSSGHLKLVDLAAAEADCRSRGRLDRRQ